MKRDEFDSQLNSLLLSAEKLIPEKDLPDLPYMELAPTVHDWYDFEHEVWEISENIRQLILTKKKDLGASQYVDHIKPYADHRMTWIKNEAKRYIQKYGL